MVLKGQLAEVRAQGRLEGDSSPAGRLSGSQTTSGPRNSQALCARPGAVTENLTRPAAALLKQQEGDSLPSGTFSLGSVAAGQSCPLSWPPEPPLLCERGT